MGLAQQSVCSSRGNGPLVNVAVLLATFLSGIQRERMKTSQFIEEVSSRAARRIRVRRATTKRCCANILILVNPKKSGSHQGGNCGHKMWHEDLNEVNLSIVPFRLSKEILLSKHLLILFVFLSCFSSRIVLF